MTSQMPLLESNLRDLRSGIIFPAYTKIMYARHMWFCGLHNNHMTGMTGFGYDLTAVSYRIAGNFRGRKLSRIGETRFSWRKLSRIARFCCAKGSHAPNFTDKTFEYSHKSSKFMKVFSLESFRYTVYLLPCSGALRRD